MMIMCYNDFVNVTLVYDDDKVLQWFSQCNISMMTKCYNNFVNVTLAYDDDKVSQWFCQCNTCALWLETNFTIISSM